MACDLFHEYTAKYQNAYSLGEARNERHELAAKARAVRRAGSDDEGSDEKEEEEEKEEDSRAFQMQQMREAAVETESAKAPKPKGGEREGESARSGHFGQR